MKKEADKVKQKDGGRNMYMTRAGLIFQWLDECRHLENEKNI